MSDAVLLHGGTVQRRSALASALRAVANLDVRVRVSSRAAEASKCLADPAVIAVFLVDAPDDADAVRGAAQARGLQARVYDLEPRDTADAVVALVRIAQRSD